MTNYNYRGMFDLSGKTAVITGAAGILGRQFCIGFLQLGANVVAADLRTEPLQQLVQELSSEYGARASGFVADVADPQSVNAMTNAAIERFGRIDILLNNAGAKSKDLTAFFQNFENYSLEIWREIAAVNLDGAFLVAQAVGRHMVQQGGGTIIQTASIYGLVASDNRIYDGSLYMGVQINNPAIYSASKAGLVGFTKWLAAYWAEKGIRVNALAPGGVFSGQNDTFVEKYSARIPMGRMAHLHEMVGTAIYLASDASSYVTGQCIAVDGGLTAW